MDSTRAQLARRILDAIAHGDSVPLEDAIQLRNWADRPKDSLRPLAEIARAILGREENQTSDAAEGGH
jgi:hypothetical protein